MKYKLRVSTIWEYGQRVNSAGFPHQEDSLVPAHGKASDADRLFIICDGMGGHAAGEVASAAVCEAMSKAIHLADTSGEGPFPVATFNRALSAAYDALDKIECTEQRKPGTTLALLKLHNDGATIAHIGDSRVYHIRPGETAEQTRILYVTSDHSLVNDLVKLGELTPEQARHSSQRNVITRAMQPNLNPRPVADLHATTDVRPGDYFYLCSDGMLEQMDDDSLREIFSRSGGDIAHKTEILTRATEQNMDNHTAILVEITDVENTNMAPRPITSMLNSDMTAAARDVEARLQKQEKQAAAAQPAIAEGAELEELPAMTEPADKPKKGGHSLWPWVIIVAIVAAACVWIFGFSGGNTETITTTDTVVITEQIEPENGEAMPEEAPVENRFRDDDNRSATREQPATDRPAREQSIPDQAQPQQHGNTLRQPNLGSDGNNNKGNNQQSQPQEKPSKQEGSDGEPTPDVPAGGQAHQPDQRSRSI